MDNDDSTPAVNAMPFFNHRTHSLELTGAWEPPFGKRKLWGSKGGVAPAILGG